jgi:hypothetical protein
MTTPLASDQCRACRHLGDAPRIFVAGKMTCRAFPDGIRDAILSGQFDHRKPYPGDNGVRFEPID